jgi:hypothetical protein
MLDINAMVRELRRKMLGVDCGDPCAEQNAVVNPAHAVQGEGLGQHEDIARHYCLYIRYCETLIDPVAPYSTGEPCGAQVCEPTRVREGIQFELRCLETAKPYGGLLTHICECLGDLDSTEMSVRDVQYFRVFAQQTGMAVGAIRDTPVPSFEQAHVDTLRQATTQLTQDLNELTQPRRARARRPSESQAAPDQRLRATLDAALETANLMARFYSRGLEARSAMLESLPDLTPALDAARGALTAAHSAPSLSVESITNTLTSPVERESAIALMEIIAKLTRENPPTDDADVRFLAENAVFTPRVQAASAKALDTLREWLLDRLDKSPHLTDCELRQAVKTVVTPAPSARENSQTPPTETLPGRTGLSEAMILTKAAESLANVFFRYLTDCLCAALNPTCAPCDDPAVLLACLEVKGCDVVRICNLDRTFVLSPTALRYWLPTGLFGQFLDQACCPISKGRDNQRASLTGAGIPGLMETLIGGGVGRAAPFLRQPSPLGTLVSLSSAVLSEVCGKDSEQLHWIIATIAELFQRQASRDLPATGGRLFSLLNTSMLAP